jgi:hypothetical protein
MAKFLWVGGSGGTWDGDHSDAMRVAEAMDGGMKLLRKAGCLDVTTNNVRLVSRKKLEPVVEQGVGDVDSAFTSLSKCRRSLSKLRCWYDSSSETYYVSDAIFFIEEDHDGGDVEVTNASFEVDKNFVTAAKDSKSGSTKSPQPSDQQECDVIKAQISLEVEAEMSSIGVCDNEDGDVSAVAVEDNVDKEDRVSKAAGDDDDKGEDGMGAIEDDISQNAKNMNVNTEKSINDTAGDNTKTDPDKTKRHTKGRTLRPVSAEDAAYLLAFYIAKEHPDVMVLERFVMCNRSFARAQDTLDT